MHCVHVNHEFKPLSKIFLIHEPKNVHESVLCFVRPQTKLLFHQGKTKCSNTASETENKDMDVFSLLSLLLNMRV